MWLRLERYFEEVTFSMQFNDFSLKFTLDPKCFRVWCSHTDDLQAQAHIKVSLNRWFHIVLTYSSKFLFYINGYAYPLIYAEIPLSEKQMIERTIEAYNDEYLSLFYEGYVKIGSIARFADIQVLPCALTRCEINAIIEQTTSIEQLNMSRYLLDHWANLHWYSRYLSNCILF
ncbi:unnamed protein product [Rotaria sp. Silwood1]|nr:unnamed protein product [Rotaria sp. Silwood1]CAF3809555.1 unnamed protein product [Rotaria sp. Silwood1]CAF3848527.1 unnamed protein product [Rotaria sp. Silwood1]CAF3870102.1 unnamed protein product [Rotaria sp. Silwood1]CAF4778963.1 unnamed protein product [Rotaria sp. Silwood1]